MNLANQLAAKAPPLPPFKASYKAIYLEPIAQSGEKLTIGVMAVSDKQHKVMQTINNKTITCMYGRNASNISNLISLTLNHAHEHLKNGGNINAWQAPLSGISTTETRETRSNAEMEGILFQAITSYSSIYNGDILVNGLNDHLPPTISEEEEANKSPLNIQVKSILSQRNEKLAKNLSKSIIGNKGERIHIDYAGAHYNANFSNFHVKTLSTAFKFAKAKLYDLQTLRSKRQNEIGDLQQFELIIQMAAKPTNQEQDTFKQIEMTADEQQLIVIKTENPTQLVNRILGKDAA